MKGRLHREPSFPQESVFTAHHDSDCDSAVWTPLRPPSGYVKVASASPVELCSPAVSPRHSREKLVSDVSKPVMAHRQNSQSSSSEQNAKQSASQRPTVHYPDDVGHEPHSAYVNSPPRFDSQVPSAASSDAEDEDEDFDWSGDEDLEEEEAKFEKQAGIKLQSRRSLWRLVLFS